MYRKLVICLVLISLSNRILSQAPSIDWQRPFDSFAPNTLFDIQRTPDNGFILAGCSDDFDIFENARVAGVGISPAMVFKTDSLGVVQWYYMTANAGLCNFYGLTSTDDNNFIGAGYIYSTLSSDGNVLLEKISNTGTRIWSKMFGGSKEDRAFSISRTIDGSVVFAGCTSSADGIVTGNHGNQDMWIGKCDMAGTLLWQKCLGGTGNDTAYNIIQLVDGSFLIAGITTSNDGNVTGNAGNTDAWLVKLDVNGNLIWQKTFGGSGNDGFKKVQVTSDGGIIAAGHTNSTDGIVSNNHGASDVWVVKCDNNGNLQWQQCYGGSADDIGSDIKPVDGGGYIINSYTTSSDGNVRTNNGAIDQWVIKVMDNGVIEWAKSIGTADNEFATAILSLNHSQFVSLANQNHRIDKGIITKLAPLNDITGTVFVDLNANGIRDTSEPFFNNATVKSVRADGYKKSSGIVNGIYINSVDSGRYETSLNFLNTNFTAEPLSHTSTFSGLFNQDQINFRLTPVSIINDVQVSVLPISGARPGFTTYYKIHYQNAGTAALSNVVIELNKDARCSIINTSLAYQSISGNTISWNIGSLPVLGEGDIELGLQMQAPPTLNNGDTLLFSVKATLQVTDNTPKNNFDTLLQVTRGSFDPNDKTETHGGIISSAQISGADALTYLIRFQNTGTDTAFNITIRDTLESKLDLNSFQMISASHNYQLSIENGNRLTWQFNDIKLPYEGIDEPASHGYIAYRIKPLSSVHEGDTIKNTAGIYFDYNLPVLTNTEKTIVLNLSAPLPVTLISFNAFEVGSSVQINWKTASEENIDHFEVQRSSNGIDFQTIGSASPGKKTYIFKDDKPLAGFNYYRLKSVDKDGKLSYSIVALVNVKNKTDIISLLYPNPSKGNISLKLQGPIRSNISIQIIDQSGITVFQKSLNAQQTNELSIPLTAGRLATGCYVLQIVIGEKKYLHKLVIQ